MNRQSQISVGLRQEQLIGVNSLTITIQRSWIRKIRAETGKTPQYIHLIKNNNGITGELSYEKPQHNYAQIRTTGADGLTYYFQIPKNYFNIFPKVQKGKYDKIICNAELSPDMQQIWWSACMTNRVDYLRENRKPIQVTYIKKIEKTLKFLNKMLTLSFIDIENKKTQINQTLKRLRVLDPMFKELVLL